MRKNPSANTSAGFVQPDLKQIIYLILLCFTKRFMNPTSILLLSIQRDPKTGFFPILVCKIGLEK